MNGLKICHKPVKLLGDDAISDPNFFLLAIDLKKRAAIFVELTRVDHRSIAFLDDHALPASRRTYLVNLDELIEFIGARPPLRQEPHFIFHTGFSCSTLLARCLDRITGCVVLKEPLVLHQIAAYRVANEKGKKYAKEWETMLDLAVRFLSRHFQKSDQIIIKADCNLLIDPILHSRASRALWLYPNTPTFILSVLKDSARRIWTRTRLRDSIQIHALQGDHFQFVDYAGHRARRLRDGEIAAAFWLSQMLLFFDARRQNSKIACKILRSEQFLRHPSHMLSLISSHFCLAASEVEISRIVRGDILQHHSKNMSIRFNYRALTVELQQLAQQYRDELQAGLKYVEYIIERLKLPPDIAIELQRSLES